MRDRLARVPASGLMYASGPVMARLTQASPPCRIVGVEALPHKFFAVDRPVVGDCGGLPAQAAGWLSAEDCGAEGRAVGVAIAAAGCATSSSFGFAPAFRAPAAWAELWTPADRAHREAFAGAHQASEMVIQPQMAVSVWAASVMRIL